MEKKKIIIADTDEKYLFPIEYKFIEELGDLTDIEIITDKAYFDRYFSSPQKADVLIVSKTLFNSVLTRHNITNTFVLSEDNEMPPALGVTMINKYSSVKEIYSYIRNYSVLKDVESENGASDTRIIVVYSPTGGMGTTTTAMGLCSALWKNHLRAVYTGLGDLQDFGCFMDNEVYMQQGFDKIMTNRVDNIYEQLKPNIVSQGFHVIPPFSRSLASMSVDMEDYIHMIEKIKESNEYNYIIADAPAEFSSEITKLMGKADNVVVITGQDRVSVHKLNCLLKNMDCSDTDKFRFVCNKYNPNQENALINSDFIKQYKLDEYIFFAEEISRMSGRELSSVSDIQKIALSYV